MFNLIKLYINKLTKDDIKSYINKNNYDISKEDIDIIYFYIKNYSNEFFINPELILSKIKKDVNNNTFNIIHSLYDKYKKELSLF